jgi:phosphate transport system substrate-binding protein
MAAFVTNASATEITGAGATFPYPIYAAWAEAYKQQTGVGIIYRGVGSAAGIAQVKAGNVTFGASDIPLSAPDLEKAALIQFPIIIGAVVPIVNLKGVDPGKLVLDGPTLADIFLGRITGWNDPQIAQLNPAIRLPASPIVAVTRGDGSGTTFLMTSYLSAVSPAFRDAIGPSPLPAWPAGLHANGSEGIAETVKQTEGAISYVEFTYTKQHKLSFVQLTNRAGRQVVPEIGALRAAAEGADWNHLPPVLVDARGSMAWPMTGVSYILMPRRPADPAAAHAALAFFAWALAKGERVAEDQGYVALPKAVATAVPSTWSLLMRTPQGTSVW